MTKITLPKERTTDVKAPNALVATITDDTGKIWGIIPVTPKTFSTGSTGYYASAKVINLANATAQYQVGLTLTLVGSKPAAKA